MSERKSEAELPALIADPVRLAEQEAENALAQFDWAMEEVERWVATKQPALKLSILLRLHELGMQRIDQYAGNFRPASVRIKGSGHEPVARSDVPRHVEEMFEYIQRNWQSKTAVHLSAYAMWRLNWIHPFADGNGRTSRIVSYMILCGHIGKILPGVPTIPEQISQNKQPYYAALEDADIHYKDGRVDVTKMEKLIENYLANQLLTVHEQATGRTVATSTLQPLSAGGPQLLRWVEQHPAFTALIVGLLGIIATIIFA